jgi:hypothetical protein
MTQKKGWFLGAVNVAPIMWHWKQYFTCQRRKGNSAVYGLLEAANFF